MTAKQEVIIMIDQLPEQQLQKIVNYIMLLKKEKKHKLRSNGFIAKTGNAASLKNRNEIRKYDFSDLAGKLKWKGDAVARTTKAQG